MIIFSIRTVRKEDESISVSCFKSMKSLLCLYVSTGDHIRSLIRKVSEKLNNNLLAVFK